VDFRIADTFTASLARLNGAEQKAVKTTAFDLQLNLSNPGLRFHRLDRPRDPNFWSVRVNDDIRLIVHRTSTSLLICFVGHHDTAYGWAARRKIERHPVTGAAQLVELPERVEIGTVAMPAGAPAAAKPLLFAAVADDVLLGYGVPPEWLDAVRRADEDSLFDLADHLPQEAAEALLNLATGTAPETPPPAQADVDPFAHPDAQRRFRVLTNIESWNGHSTTRGRNGRSSCTPRSAAWSSAPTMGRHAYRALPAPARRSSRCIAPSRSHRVIPRRGCC
jgi:mRNA-degrading endonuclease RelE of RelBE toxin-antitoxin system